MAEPTVARSWVADSTTIGRRGIIAAQLREEIESVRPRQRQIEQHQRAIRMPCKRGQRLLAIDRCQHIERAMEMRKRMCERLLDQRVIVDDQYLQGGSPFRGVVRFCGARREIYGEVELAKAVNSGSVGVGFP